MKLKKSVQKKGKIVLLIIIIFVILACGFLIYKRFFVKDNKPNKVKIEEKIDDYGYVLEENESKLYKDLFKELIKTLNKDEIEGEKYASLVAELLVVDFYNLDNKISKNDIGGVQFIKSEYQENFALEASETVYKYIEHNIYGNREQELPVVSKVEVVDVEKTTYRYNDIVDDNTYKVNVKLEYEKDLGYPSNVTVVLIHNDKKLEVIKMY